MEAISPSQAVCRTRRWTVVLAAGLAVSAAACLAAGPAATDHAANPHWKSDGCANCHQVKDGKPGPIARAGIDAMCVSCHDGSRAYKEAHSIGGAGRTDQIESPSSWPLDDGRIGCLTCHDARQACDQALRRSSDNPRFLRGARAAGSPAVFCANCHKARHYPKFNPHIMLNEDRSVRQDHCLFCHTRVLDRDIEARTGDAAFKTAPAALCRTCHLAHKDPFGATHLDAVMSPQMQAYLCAREALGLMSPVSSDRIEQIRAAGLKPSRMVLGDGGAIRCVTCHNPHQRWLFKPQSALAYRAMHVVEDERVVSPVRGEQWCVHCHDM